MPFWRQQTKRISPGDEAGQASIASSIWQPLSNPAESTRVFELHAGSGSTILRLTLREFDISKPNTQYEAISYTWGTEAREKDVIINNKFHKIRVNLWDFLSCLRRPSKSRILWADAICISQNDLAEKGHQVASLGRIFSKADRVLVWMGSSANSSDDVFKTVTETSNSSRLAGSLLWPQRSIGLGLGSVLTGPQKVWFDDPRSRYAMEALLNRPYWRRTWIIQEIVLANEVILHCGDSKINWSLFTSFNWYFSTYMSQRGRPALQLTYDSSGTNPVTLLEEARKDWRGRGATADLTNAIHRFRRTECLDARDKIYALLSLARNKSSKAPLMPNYVANRVEVFFNVYEYCWGTAFEEMVPSFGTELREALELQPTEIEKGLATRKDLIERLGTTEEHIYRDVSISRYTPGPHWMRGATQ